MTQEDSMTAIEDASAARDGLAKITGGSSVRDAVAKAVTAFDALIAENERLTTTPPWDSSRACFGHCDKEGWYSECVSKAAPPTDDEREATENEARARAEDEYPDRLIPYWGEGAVMEARKHFVKGAVWADLRRQGPITDAQVKASAEAIFKVDLGDNWDWDKVADPQDYIDMARAALEAARDAS